MSVRADKSTAEPDPLAKVPRHLGGHFLVRRHVIPYIFRECAGQRLTRMVRSADLLILDLEYGQKVARRRSNEHLVDRLQIAVQQRLLFDPDARSADLAQEH